MVIAGYLESPTKPSERVELHAITADHKTDLPAELAE